MLALLDVTASAQRAVDRDDYDIGSRRATEVVDAEHDARRSIREEVDSAVREALRGP